MNNFLNLISVSELIDKRKFYIAYYQRGYRWGKTEVETLLNDINEYGGKIRKTDNDNYCLQPVVVRNLGDKYELIDGQQRLTTLYLIYVYIHNLLFFI